MVLNKNRPKIENYGGSNCVGPGSYKMIGRNEDVNLLKLRFIFPNSSKRQTLVLGSDGRIIIFYFG